MVKKKKQDKELEKAIGKIASEDKKTFSKILSGIHETYDINSPVEVMTANRLAATFMKMRYIESKLSEYGVVYKSYDKDGNLTMRVNEMAYYLKQLESEFRSYVRLLGQKKDTNSGPKTFSELLEG